MYIMNKGYKSQYVNCDCDTLFVTVHNFIANHSWLSKIDRLLIIVSRKDSDLESGYLQARTNYLGDIYSEYTRIAP
jgi:hypothetical protein